MEFSVALPTYLQSFVDIQDAGIFLVFFCCFGILILAAVLGLLMKPFQQQTKLYIMVIIPVLLTWPIASIFTVVLNALDIEAIKIITMIMIIYLLMILYCMLNINLLAKYIHDSSKKS
ncbi:hypothetical protein N8878_01540 [Psychromonas sp.]|nr:hypothetical protein [Psychromonas sp.]